MTAATFAEKWQGCQRNERAAAQEHFIDLCALIGVDTPNAADPSGEWYAFEKGAEKIGGGDGFADVWKRDHFAWEYKGKRKNLVDAYQQLLQYREDLENPPLLIVCDLERFEIHTNFTGTAKKVHAFTLDDLANDPAGPLEKLRCVMLSPTDLKPDRTPEQVTEEVATHFAELARSFQRRGHEPLAVARFLNRLLFCFFAESMGLIRGGIVGDILHGARGNPTTATKLFQSLFTTMAAKGGGYFGADYIQWFNGGLFQDNSVLPLDKDDLHTLAEGARADWSSVEPAILGTLFERAMDPDKRSQLGAHYTDKASILSIIEPVIMVPLRREFTEVKKKIAGLLKRGKRGTAAAKGKENPNRVFRAFLTRLRSLVILDPACGSGNFLYLALRAVKDFEKTVIRWGSLALQLSQELPFVGPQIVRGIEINEYAAELARVSVWIGEIQWMIDNGYSYLRDPVLRPLDTIKHADAIVDRDGDGNARRVAWPSADFIVGNPPFLGGKKLRSVLGDEYVDALFRAWYGDVPAEADLVAYWHESAREMIESKRAKRAGLLATQGIRGGANQRVLKRITESGAIFHAKGNIPWVLDGANVRVSIICQDGGSETERILDGKRVDSIRSDLRGGDSAQADITTAQPLAENLGISFMGDTKGGSFDIDMEAARQLLRAPRNVNGRKNDDVVFPWVNGLDLVRRPRNKYIVDFGVDMTEADASKYEAPFEYLRATVKKERADNPRDAYKKRWWLHVEARPAMRAALAGLQRFIGTPRNGWHRIFVWIRPPVLPDSQVIVIARDDWYTFGVLQSRIHDLWTRRICTVLESGTPRYIKEKSFEAFPFPFPMSADLAVPPEAEAKAIAVTAESLDQQRRNWLNPEDLVASVPGLAANHPAITVPTDDAAEGQLRPRTLTRLYNSRPTWLDRVHKSLDAAVIAAYGWEPDVSDDQILDRLLRLNLERSKTREAA